MSKVVIIARGCVNAARLSEHPNSAKLLLFRASGSGQGAVGSAITASSPSGPGHWIVPISIS